MALTKVRNQMIEGAAVNVLDYGADPTGVVDSYTAFQTALDASTEVYIPEGNYKISATLKLTRQGATLTGSGHPAYPYEDDVANVYGGTWLIWTGSTGNVIELNSRRRDLPSAVTVLTGAYVADFSVALGAGSSCANVIWVENGVFHSTVERLYIQSYYGGLPTEAVLKLASGTTGADYPLGISMRDITVRNSDPGSTVAIPIGLHVQGGIESVFERIAIYDCDDGFAIGDPTPALNASVQNCTFTACIAEIGDRYSCNELGSSISIYEASSINFYGCKFVSAAYATGAPWEDHVTLRLKGNSSGSPEQINFNGCLFWGYQISDYAVQVAQDCVPQNVNFTSCSFLAYATGTVITVTPATPELIFNDCDYRRAKFAGNPRTTFSASGYKTGALSMTTKTLLRVNATEQRPPSTSVLTLCSASHNGGEPLLITAAQQTYGLYGTEYAIYNAGTGTATIDALNNLRVRPMMDTEIGAQASIYTAGPFVGNGNTVAIDIIVPGAALGDHALAAYQSLATPIGASGTLFNIQISATVSAANTVTVMLMNKTGAGLTLPAGYFHAGVIKPRFDLSTANVYDAPSIADVAELLYDITVTGVLAGDYVSIAPSASVSGLFMKGTVKTANTVTMYFYNSTGSPVDLASMTYYVGVIKQKTSA